MSRLWNDIKFGFRMLAKNPVFTIAVVFVLALGIAANTAIFSVVKGVLLDPLAYKNPERLVTLLHQGRYPVSPADFLDWKEQQQSFDDLAAAEAWGGTLTGYDVPQAVRGLRMGEGLFSLLGVQPLLGRTFAADEFEPGKDRVLVLGYSLWRRLFGGREDVVGQPVTLDGQVYTIIGVMPNGFQFPLFWYSNAEMWSPLSLAGRETNRGGNSLRVFGRLKQGISLQQAQVEMDAVCKRLEAQYPDSNTGRTVSVDPLREKVTGDIQQPLFILQGAVGFVLLLACINAANLLLARNAKRQGEISIRLSLGAGRRRILMQLLTESVLLSLIAGLCSVLPSIWILEFIKALCLDGDNLKIPRLESVGIDLSVLSFMLLVSMATGVVFGLLPALKGFRQSVAQSMKETGRSMMEGRQSRQARSYLVVAQVALSLALLVGAGLFMRSFMRLQAVDPGFNPRNVLSMKVSLAGTPQYTGEERVLFYDTLFGKIHSLPGVETVSAINHLPLDGDLWSSGIAVEGFPLPPPGQRDGAAYRVCSPNYFQTMGISLLQGRDFSAQDVQDTQSVAIINETLARGYWQGQSPIGKRITFDDPLDNPNWLTIVGVVENVRLSEWIEGERNEIYLPFVQQPNYVNGSQAHYSYMTLTIKTAIPPTDLAAAVQGEVWSINKDIPVSNVTTLDEVVDDAVWQQRFNLLLMAVFAVTALLLATVGIYGVVSYSVTQRTREIGVRMALGAKRGDVAALIVRHGMTLVFFGVVFGLALSFVLTRFLSSQLYGINPTDPLTFASIASLLGFITLIACWIPARRASKVDPMTALRCE